MRQYYDELIEKLSQRYPNLRVYDQRPDKYTPYKPGSTFVGHTTGNNPMKPTASTNPYLSRHYTGVVGHGEEGPYVVLNKHYDQMPTGLYNRNKDYAQQWAWAGDDKFRVSDTLGGKDVKSILRDVLEFHKQKGSKNFIGHGELGRWASKKGRPKNEAMWMQNWRKEAAEKAYQVAQRQQAADGPSMSDAISSFANDTAKEWAPSVAASAAYGQDDFSSTVTSPITLGESSEPPIGGPDTNRFDFMGGADVPQFKGAMPSYGADADAAERFDFAPGAETDPTNRFDFGAGQLLKRQQEEQVSARDSVMGAYNQGIIPGVRPPVVPEHPGAMAPPTPEVQPTPPLPTQQPGSAMPPLPQQAPMGAMPPLPQQGPAMEMGPRPSPEAGGGGMPPPPSQAPKTVGPPPMMPNQTDNFSTYMHGKMQGALNTGPTQYVPRNQPPVSPMNFSLAGLLKGIF